jgi:hypothetical protein
MKTLALRARVFIHCFLVFGYPGETLALVVHILHEAFKRCLFCQCRHSNVRSHFRNAFHVQNMSVCWSTKFYISAFVHHQHILKEK